MRRERLVMKKTRSGGCTTGRFLRVLGTHVAALVLCLTGAVAEAAAPADIETSELTRAELRATRKGRDFDEGVRALRRDVAIEFWEMPAPRTRAVDAAVLHPLLVSESLDGVRQGSYGSATRARINHGLEIAIAADLGALDDLHATAVWRARMSTPGPALDHELESLRDAMEALRAHAIATHRAWTTLIAGEVPDEDLVDHIEACEADMALLLADENLADAFGSARTASVSSVTDSPHDGPRARIELIAGRDAGDLWVDMLVPMTHSFAGQDMPVLVELRDVRVPEHSRCTVRLPEGWVLEDPADGAAAHAVENGAISRQQIITAGPNTLLRVETRK